MDKFDFEDTTFSMFDGFEDATDCAILNDDQVEESILDMETEKATTEPETDEDEVVDVNVDYDEDVPSADMVDIDADDVIAAERDIAYDPFEDDEIIDAVVGDDEIELDDDEIEEEE